MRNSSRDGSAAPACGVSLVGTHRHVSAPAQPPRSRVQEPTADAAAERRRIRARARVVAISRVLASSSDAAGGGLDPALVPPPPVVGHRSGCFDEDCWPVPLCEGENHGIGIPDEWSARQMLVDAAPRELRHVVADGSTSADQATAWWAAYAGHAFLRDGPSHDDALRAALRRTDAAYVGPSTLPSDPFSTSCSRSSATPACHSLRAMGQYAFEPSAIVCVLDSDQAGLVRVTL